jgi:CheY-like chemotaxis protein
MNLVADGWRGVRVLIVEDEYFLAQDLADWFQSLGAEVLGPAGTVAQALTLARGAGIDGAILDVNLRGERVYPVADLLMQRRIAFVFASGYGGELEPDAYSHVPRCIKPVNFTTLAKALANQIKANAEVESRSYETYQRSNG